MNVTAVPADVRLIRLYYATTAVFIILDYFLNINVRLAALDQAPVLRALYYLFCFACLGLMVWRPAWTSWIASGESLITLSLLIISMEMRVIVVTDEMIESGRGVVTLSEIVNFAIASGITYLAFWHNSQRVRRDF